MHNGTQSILKEQIDPKYLIFPCHAKNCTNPATWRVLISDGTSLTAYYWCDHDV